MIVGAGITGLYILREALKTNPQLKTKDVLVLDAGTRIGGRIWTDKIISGNAAAPGAININDFVLCEEGAMRICVEYEKDDPTKFAKDQVYF